MLRAIRGVVAVTALSAVCVAAQATYITGVTDSPGGLVTGNAAQAKAAYELLVNITATETFGSSPTPSGISANGFASSALGATIGCVFPGDGLTRPDISACSIQSLTSDSGPTDNGRFNTSSALDGNFLRNDPNTIPVDEGTSIIFDFRNAFSAFGFYLTDLGDFVGGLEISIFKGEKGTGDVEKITLPSSTQNGSLGFFGFYSTDSEYRSFSIRIPVAASADIFGIDDVFIGEFKDGTDPQVPEPSTIALLGASLLAASRIQRRRQSAP